MGKVKKMLAIGAEIWYNKYVITIFYPAGDNTVFRLKWLKSFKQTEISSVLLLMNLWFISLASRRIWKGFKRKIV